MTESEQTDALLNEGRTWIKRIRKEWGMSYAAMIGVLEIMKHDLLEEEKQKRKEQ